MWQIQQATEPGDIQVEVSSTCQHQERKENDNHGGSEQAAKLEQKKLDHG